MDRYQETDDTEEIERLEALKLQEEEFENNKSSLKYYLRKFKTKLEHQYKDLLVEIEEDKDREKLGVTQEMMQSEPVSVPRSAAPKLQRNVKSQNVGFPTAKSQLNPSVTSPSPNTSANPNGTPGSGVVLN